MIQKFNFQCELRFHYTTSEIINCYHHKHSLTVNYWISCYCFHSDQQKQFSNSKFTLLILQLCTRRLGAVRCSMRRPFMPNLFTFRYFSLYTNTFQMHATRKNALAKVFYALEYDLQPLPKAVECGWLCGAPSCSNLNSSTDR